MTESITGGLSWTAFSLIITGVMLNAIAQLALKASVIQSGVIQLDFTSLIGALNSLAGNAWLWLGLLCYAVSVVVWILALSRVDVSIAYPMLSIGYAVNAIAAWQLFDEQLSLGRVLGIGIIIVGVYVLART